MLNNESNKLCICWIDEQGYSHGHCNDTIVSQGTISSRSLHDVRMSLDGLTQVLQELPEQLCAKFFWRYNKSTRNSTMGGGDMQEVYLSSDAEDSDIEEKEEQSSETLYFLREKPKN